MKHVTGLEPAPPAWKAGMLPITPHVRFAGRQVFLFACRLSARIALVRFDKEVPGFRAKWVGLVSNQYPAVLQTAAQTA